MYGYAGVIPTILWGAMKWYGCEPSLLEILCLYGYGGMLVWIPVVCNTGVCGLQLVSLGGDYTDILIVRNHHCYAVGFDICRIWLVCAISGPELVSGAFSCRCTN